MNCDLCGKETETLFRAKVEGTELNLCKGCSKHGKVMKEIKTILETHIKKKSLPVLPERELIQVIVPDYSEIIKKKREQLGLKQKEFAKKISEKESLIHKMEIGHFEPPIILARKLEKFLKVKLVEEHEEVRQKTKKSSSEGFTIGDLVDIKK